MKNHLLLQGSEPSSYQVYLTFPCSYVGRWKQSSSLHATRDYTDLSHLSSASLLQVIHHMEAITDLWWPVLHYSILLAVLYSSEMKGRGDETLFNVWTNHRFRHGIIVLFILFFTLLIAFPKILRFGMLSLIATKHRADGFMASSISIKIPPRVVTVNLSASLFMKSSGRFLLPVQICCT